ncbi:hypothetical protein PsYK624_151110 [Phanerochaete sordida]|uniref:F-box domain-containing protein n=1 Tax=Phanerochaete sordida TaxID=48140 RepID=A0A9P3LLN1_9APHY|nr:hypothetical protein PsYK624_151110 [Phanerochaete sordida]
MHRCLKVHEIIQLIAEALNTDRYATQQSVLNLGKTCRAFYDPAMNVLWRVLHDFTPLLRCFPKGVVMGANDRERYGGRHCASYWVRTVLSVPQPGTLTRLCATGLSEEET